jgi:hypothetical protein
MNNTLKATILESINRLIELEYDNLRDIIDNTTGDISINGLHLINESRREMHLLQKLCGDLRRGGDYDREVLARVIDQVMVIES